jgi:hypothetical protein
VVFDSASKTSSRDRSNRSTGVCVRNIRVQGDTIVCDIIVKPESVGVAEHFAPDSRPLTAQAAPNPFSCQVDLSLPAGSEARIYSTAGALVWRARVPRSGRLKWNGSDESGAGLPEGVYVVQAIGTPAAALKVVLRR